MKKIIIALLGLVLVLVLVLRGIPFFVNIYLNNNADKIVSNMITRTSGFGNHDVTFGNIKLDYNYFGTFLSIEDIRIQPTENILAGQVKVNLHLEQAKITGFKWKSFLLDNSIQVDSARLENLTIMSVTPPIDSLNIDKEESQNKKKNDTKDYDKIGVGSISLQNLNLENKDSNTDSTRLSLKNLSVDSRGFVLTKEDIQNEEALFSVEFIHGEIEHVEIHFDEFRQKAEVKNLVFDTEDKNMKIEDFSILNKLGKYAYTESFKKRKGWIQLKNGTLDIHGMNFQDYFRKGIVEIDSLLVKDIKLESFTNKLIPDDYEKRPPMAHEAFGILNFPLNIKNTIIRNGHILVEEQPDNGAPNYGSIFFSELNAEIGAISNMDKVNEDKNELNIQAEALLMGKGKINLSVMYDLADTRGAFQLQGSLGKFDLTEINDMVEPEAKISLKSGMINRLDFNIHAFDFDGSGEVIVRYDNLEIEILNKDFEKDKNLFRRIGAFLANKVIIKSQNPRKNGDLQKGVVYAQRLKHKSEFNYWWQLLFSGLKSTVTGDNLEDLKKKANEEK
ncbi:hypothetical protein MM213_13950 [Belliella sp. R4-6]|uniref:AsmA family protein n=1 Tax=Belliella alkalica TaxID=1730871 RepID=A0ABS9VDX8_9BACT|nr:hypothetical protein [Belliella alkalica]MCH7414598.1 hypothetical protein [Belliella alkalica]